MIRSLGAVAAGYISIIFLNAFVNFIVAVYSKSTFSVAAVAESAGPLLVFAMLAAGFLFGLIGGLLTCSITQKNAVIPILSLIILVIAAELLAYHFAVTPGSVWYIIISPLLKVMGILAAFYIKTGETNSLNQPSAS